jgi:hypothetical protein
MNSGRGVARFFTASARSPRASADIDGVDTKAGRQLGRAHPKPLAANLESRRVLGEPDVPVQRQARRIVADQGCKVAIDEAGHADPVTGGRDATATLGGG